MNRMQGVVVLFVAALVVLGVYLFADSFLDSTPAVVGEASGAQSLELAGACSILSRYGWDYETLDHSFVVDRMMEVANDIHSVHDTPEKARKYCLEEVFG